MGPSLFLCISMSLIFGLFSSNSTSLCSSILFPPFLGLPLTALLMEFEVKIVLLHVKYGLCEHFRPKVSSLAQGFSNVLFCDPILEKKFLCQFVIDGLRISDIKAKTFHYRQYYILLQFFLGSGAKH